MRSWTFIQIYNYSLSVSSHSVQPDGKKKLYKFCTADLNTHIHTTTNNKSNSAFHTSYHQSPSRYLLFSSTLFFGLVFESLKGKHELSLWVQICIWVFQFLSNPKYPPATWTTPPDQYSPLEGDNSGEIEGVDAHSLSDQSLFLH